MALSENVAGERDRTFTLGAAKRVSTKHGSVIIPIGGDEKRC
jgi:hypothetical protein